MKTDNLTDFLTDVADAIRAKKGTTDKINPQDFSNEIRRLPIGDASPFAIDFGEEIASGNPTFINALQEDINYYNEIQRKRASGEITNDAELAKSQEFRDKIAWWPKGMSPDTFASNYTRIPYKRLKSFVFPECKKMCIIYLSFPRLLKKWK